MPGLEYSPAAQVGPVPLGFRALPEYSAIKKHRASKTLCSASIQQTG